MAAGGKRRGMIIIIIAVFLIIIVGAVYAYITFFRGPQQTAQPIAQATPVSEMQDIVITTQAVSRGTAFTADVLAYVPYPRSELVAGTFITDMNEVVGRRAKYDLDPRVPITPSMVVDQPTGSLASFWIPAGMTAISMPITRQSAVSYAPQMGDHVMIIGCMLLVDMDTEFQTEEPNFTSQVVAPGPGGQSGTTVTATILTQGDVSKQGQAEIDPNLNMAIYTIPAEPQRPRLVCQTVIQDATILRVGDFTGEVLPSEGTEAPATEGQAPAPVAAPNIVTLVVTPQDSVMLTYLMTANVQLTLSLRSAGDLQQFSTQPVTLQFIMDQKNVQLPAKLPYGITPRLDALNIPYEDWPNSAQ